MIINIIKMAAEMRLATSDPSFCLQLKFKLVGCVLYFHIANHLN